MTRSVTFFAIGILVLTATPARAQSLDYGALEELFGEPVSTSATGKPQKVSEVPINMEIITQDDIRRSGADNIPDILQFVTGIAFRRSSFNDGEVSIRGYDQPWNPRLLVLVNNRPVYEDFYGDVVWSAIPVQLDEIRQIEVIKGPNSALFGFNAASGVINIVTFDPQHDTLNSVTARTGTQGLREGSIVATAHPTDTWGVRLSAGGMRAHEFTTDTLPGENTANLLRPRNDMVNIDSRWQITDDVELTVEGAVGEMQRNFPADETPESDRTRTMRARLQADTALGLLDIDAYRNIWNINYEGNQAQQAVNTDDDVRASDLFKIGANHSIRLGLEYKYNQAQGQFFNRSTIDYTVLSASVMWDWQVTPSLSLTNSVREDYLHLGMKGGLLPQTGLSPSDFNNTLIHAVSFNSGAVYAASPQDTIRLMAARGFQLPSLNDFGQQIRSGGTVLEMGQPHLRPTSVLNFEGDYDHTFPDIDATLRTAVFQQYNYNLFGYDVGMPVTSGSTTIDQSANIGSSNESGGEISLRNASTVGLRWNAGYTFATIDDHINPSVVSGVYSAFKGSTPHHALTFGLGYAFDRWELDSQARWQDKYTDYRYTAANGYIPVTIANYWITNVRIGFKATDDLTVALTLDQLNESRLIERASLPTERRVIFSATARF